MIKVIIELANDEIKRELIHSRNERQETRLVPQGLCSGTLDTLRPTHPEGAEAPPTG